jgi:Family of unknown function (DUF5996)
VAVVAGLADLRIKVKIGEWPNEVPDPIRFGEDRTHAAYDPEYARRFWRILLQGDRAFKLLVQPRAFLLGQLRFGGDAIFTNCRMRSCARHIRLSSAGFWPGGGGARMPARRSRGPARSFIGPREPQGQALFQGQDAPNTSSSSRWIRRGPRGKFSCRGHVPLDAAHMAYASLCGTCISLT